MTIIDENLEHAYCETEGQHDSATTLPVVFRSPPAAAESLHMDEEMLSLHQGIESLLPRSPRKIIQFIGSIEGEGTSSIAREFARVSASAIGKSVLLLDANRVRPSHHRFFPVRLDTDWLDAMRTGRRIGGALYQIDDSDITDSPSSSTTTCGSDIFISASIDSFWNILRHRFDLIVIDSNPLTQSPDGLAIAPKVDGVVLVVEAERTRWTVVDSVKNRINKVGGNLLGIVLNKRRYYIPQSIYKRLR